MDEARRYESVNTESVSQKPKIENDFVYPDGYIERIKLIHSKLEKLLTLAPDNFNLGPTYHLQTSKNESIMVETFSFDFLFDKKIKQRKYYLVAQNIDGKIIGDRTLSVTEREFKKDKYARAEGMISTGKRGGSVASVIEAVSLDILQHESDRLGIRVDWHISNQNGEILRDLQEDFRLSPSLELKELIDKKVVEQDRWQAVYGIGGKLGFDETGIKKFSPDDSPEKYNPKNCTIDLPPTQADAYTNARKEVLSRVMSRMANVVSASEN